jgi:PhnB protein
MTTTTGLQTLPEGYATVTPWIVARRVAELIPYLEEAFEAEEIARIPNEDGSIGHAEVRIGGSTVMMFDAAEDWPDTPAFLRLYVDDAEAAHKRAVQAGGTSVTDVTELFFGERVGRVRDPWGDIWWIQERLHELEPDEMARRADQPRYAEAMRYVQESLQLALGG